MFSLLFAPSSFATVFVANAFHAATLDVIFSAGDLNEQIDRFRTRRLANSLDFCVFYVYRGMYLRDSSFHQSEALSSERLLCSLGISDALFLDYIIIVPLQRILRALELACYFLRMRIKLHSLEDVFLSSFSLLVSKRNCMITYFKFNKL